MNSDGWCVKCAKYLAFGTFETADDSALRAHGPPAFEKKSYNIYIYTKNLH